MTYDPGSGARKDVTRYALGARGGDMAETVLAAGGTGESTVRSYPLYDGHGNTVGQVARAEDGAPDASFAPVPGAANFALGARRKCGAWGQVRWSEGSPLDQGYCGSLQHRRDAESGLVYMRARYYEPWTGRFLSEDPAMDGANWYVYCGNDPVNRVDPEGKLYLSEATLRNLLTRFSAALMYDGTLKVHATTALIAMQTWLQVGLFDGCLRDREHVRKTSWIATFQGVTASSSTTGIGSIKDRVQAFYEGYGILLLLSMWVMDEDDWYGVN